MYGAIIGDIAGSTYEYDEFKEKRNYLDRLKIFKDELIKKESFFSDDTILTIAILDSILNDVSYETNLKKYGNLFDKKMEKENCFTMYFSKNFTFWFRGKHEGNSIGNGSAMRVSPVAYLYDKPAIILEEAKKSALPSHNTKEGIYGAQAIVNAIYFAKTGYDKKQIKFLIERNYGYNLNFDLNELQQNYKFYQTCNTSVPQAIYIALISNSYEETIRNAISIGGDTDTIAAMAGSIAESLYGIPPYLIEQANEKLPEEFKQLLNKGYSRIRR